MTDTSPTDAILEILRPLSDSERVAVINKIEDAYCLHCGRQQPDGMRRCQCQNDE